MQKETKSQCVGTSKPSQLDYFNLYLQLPTSELIWEIGGAVHLSPDHIDFIINPRRLRGSDFLMRWAQGRWSEEIVIRALIWGSFRADDAPQNIRGQKWEGNDLCDLLGWGYSIIT